MIPLKIGVLLHKTLCFSAPAWYDSHSTLPPTQAGLRSVSGGALFPGGGITKGSIVWSSSIFVCLMGMGTVFFGLICLIALTYLMSAVVGRGKKAAPAPVPAAPQTAGEVTPELVAAVSAALAEELGTDITGIRIVSMKKV